VPGVVFCPCPPLLVPDVAQGAAAELEDLRTACEAAVRGLVRGARSVVVVGAGTRSRVHPGDAAGSLAGFGVPVRSGGAAAADLPLSLTVGAWLLDRAGAGARRRYVEVGPDGARPAPGAERWPGPGEAMLVMGDGSARLGARAPGGLDAGAAGYDESVLAALGSGDPAALVALDLPQGQRQLAAGAAAWAAAGAALLAGRRTWAATVLSHQAPYGVSYILARWEPAR